MPDPNRIIRLPELLELIPYSRAHLYGLEKAGHFPRRLKLGMRRIGWRSSDIADWVSRRAEEANLDGGRHE